MKWLEKLSFYLVNCLVSLVALLSGRAFSLHNRENRYYMLSMNNENTKGFSNDVTSSEPRVYELGYLIMPSVDEGDLGTQRDALVALITRFEGIVIDEGQPALIDLAYEMDKLINNKRAIFNQAYFGWIKFDVSPRGVEALTKEIEAVQSLIRFILVKTIKENTLTSEQPYKLAKTSGDVSNDSEEDIEIDEVDDLTMIEGIGSVIAETLADAGIETFEALAGLGNEKIQSLITDVKGVHDSSTWAQQAQLARDGKFEELKNLQSELKGGVKEEE